MTFAYYNEIDPYAAEWLRRLIDAGHIAPGVVDTRSIEDIHPIELHEFTQCHFFAGIGVWSRALRLAGWPDDRPVWTGSCPCQPFSAAGKGAGFADERHLWPAFHHLIEECRPPVVFGEQVASKDGLAWLDLVRADLEATGYAAGAADLCAAGIGAPHIRQRLYWVADAECRSSERHGLEMGATPRGSQSQIRPRAQRVRHDFGHGINAGRLADAPGAGPQGLGPARPARPGSEGPAAERTGEAGGMADAAASGFGVIWRGGSAGARHQGPHAELNHEGHRSRPTHGHWRDADWLCCRDGKWRPVEPGTFPLAHGAANRVGRLRAYGNAIVPQVAQTFIEAYLDIQG